jgi:streptogramin lyase
MNNSKNILFLLLLSLMILLNIHIGYSQEYEFVKKWGSMGTDTSQFNQPGGIFIDEFGFIYVTEGQNHRIQKFTPNGEFMLQWGTHGSNHGEFKQPTDIVVAPDGLIFVVDSDNHRIQKFDQDGNFLLTWGRMGSEDSLNINLNGIAIDSKKYIYVADMLLHKIIKFDSVGTFIMKWGSSGTGNGQFNFAAKIAIDKYDNVYVTDGNGRRVQKFTSDGVYLDQWGSSGTGDGQFGNIRGIAVDQSCNVYVCDWTNHRIQKFDSDGKFITKWGSYGTGNGQFNEPYDIAVDIDGSVYVAERLNHRIQKFVPIYSLADTSDNLWAIIKPLAESQDIDMGKVFINTTKDAVISGYIRNIGTAQVRIDSIKIKFIDGDTTLFGIVSGLPPFSIPVGGQKDVEFRFWPKTVGDKSADIYIFTQSDTLKQKIIGEGIYNSLEITADIIDFDKVRIGTAKDSLIVLLRNIGASDVNITSTDLLGPDKTQFIIDSGGGSFNLPVGGERELKVQFAPLEKGRTSGQIGFYYNNVGSPAIAYLYGEGIGVPKISSTAPDFPALICNQREYDTITVSNPGSVDLFLSEAEISGAEASDFILDAPFSPDTLEPGQAEDYVIRYAPQNFGTSSAALTFKSNAEPDSILTIPLIGRKDSVEISLSNTLIDIGVLCPNETKDTTVEVRNIGTILTGVSAVSPQYFMLDIQNFILDTTEMQNVNIHFNGDADEGVINQQITFTDTICGYSKTVDITATIAGTEIRASDLILNAVVGDNDEGTITISNPSSRDVDISEPNILNPPFEIIAPSPSFPLTIPAGGSADITIRYTPSDTIIIRDTLMLAGQPCDAMDSCVISGFPSPASAILQVGSAQAKPGDSIEIPIYLRNPQNVIQSKATGFKANLSFNTTLLDPIDYSNDSIIDGIRIIEINDIPVQPDENSVLKTIKFVVGLGNSKETELTLTNYESIGGIVALDTIGGKFTLLGICPEGGNRLLNPEGKVQFMSIIPNPTNEKVEIEFELIESGYTKLFITNILGIKVKTLIDGKPRLGRQKITINTKGLSSGTYFIILQTPTEVRSRRMEIVK